MAKFRPIVFAAALAGFAGAAHAADLLPPPPGLPPAPAVAPMAMSGGNSGWYIRGDLGATVSNPSAWSGSAAVAPAGFATLQDTFGSQYLSGDSFGDVGFGYQLNGWLRADATLELHGAQSANGLTTQIFNSTTTPCTIGGAGGSCQFYQDHFNGAVHSQALMLNAYADLGTWYGVSPFVGLGIGVARHSTGGFLDNGVAIPAGTGFTTAGGVVGPTSTVAYNPVSANTNYSFAWAVMAGLSFDVTQNLKAEIGYRYIDMGKAKTGNDNCLCGVTYPGFSMEAREHDIRIGLRWMLGGDYPPPPPPAPIVSRY